MLILASASPRRAELLRSAGIEFRVHAAEIAETRRANESPQQFVLRLAEEKATAVAAREADSHWVLAADTVVVVSEDALGKPADADDAKRMLRLLSGRTHQVMTAVCLRGQNTAGVSFNDLRLASTEVCFEPLSKREIEAYVATAEPFDKAGAYAIQGRASRWISAIRGDYCNVVGLPVFLVYRMLREHGAL